MIKRKHPAKWCFCRTKLALPILLGAFCDLHCNAAIGLKWDAVLDITNGFLLNRDLTFTVRRAKLETPYVLADAVRIREVLVNILGNADFCTQMHPMQNERVIAKR